MDCDGNCGEWKRWKLGGRALCWDTWGITVGSRILRLGLYGGNLESVLENRIA